MSAARRDHTATLLADGQVLLAGGSSAAGLSLKTTDRYTLSPKGMIPGGSMSAARAGHAEVRLASGDVLVTGGLVTGFAQQSAEIYKVSTDAFGPVSTAGGASPQMTAPRAYHTATLLASGAVLVAGGVNDAVGTIVWDTAEIFLDGATKRGFVQPVLAMTAKRSSHTASLLPSGGVLLAGGEGGLGAVATTEVYDPTVSSFAAFAPLLAARRGHAAVVVNGGGSTAAGRGVLVTGGVGATGAALASAEVAVRPLGDACTLDAECNAGHCVAGICCDEACVGTCRSCTAAGKGSGADGVCGNAAAGTPAGVACAAGTDVEEHRSCDGNGSSVIDSLKICKPNACAPDGLACLTYCDDTLPCSASGWCDVGAAGDGGIPDDAGPHAGTCQDKQDNAAQCTADIQCKSGHCVDDVCCENACTGQCEACDSTGFVGLCRPVGAKDAPEPPHGTRTACAGSGTCQGVCDGTSPLACAFPNEGVSCGASSCACSDGDCATAARTRALCDAQGACTDVTDACPNGLRCGDDGCLATCKTDDDCVLDSFCNPQTKGCEALEGPRCDGAHTVKIPMTEDQDCTPYRCSGEACLTECKSVDDCVSPSVCDVSGKCIPQLTAPVITSCAATPANEAPRSAALGLLGLWALASLRRRVRSRDAR
ncbi:MAG: kelch repeat-containing protein [Minicystis sp.]